jgi:probable rRNA maturation factor
MNQQHLNHDYYTDIITFNLSDDANMLDCELYISLERIIDNAQTQNVSIENEYLRVIAHGLLHLLGYNDKQEKEKEIMRAQEDGWIQQFDRIVSRGTK